ncbi:MAG: hypothetical protein EOP53_15485, partial [Sphingobacteriales bacterium]
MESLIPGIVTIAICALGFYFAWRSYQSGKYRFCLFFVLLCGLILRLFTDLDPQLHTWDERFHALVAKNLIQHPLKPTLYENPVLSYDYKNWIGNHIWLEKGPVPLWSIAASIRLFGTNVYAVRLPSLIISTLGIYITFLLGLYLFDKRIGLLAAFFHAVNGLAIELAAGRISSDHVETFFVFFTELGILFCVLSILQKRSYLFAMLCAVGVLRASGALDLALDGLRWLVSAVGMDTRFVDA